MTDLSATVATLTRLLDEARGELAATNDILLSALAEVEVQRCRAEMRQGVIKGLMDETEGMVKLVPFAAYKKDDRFVLCSVDDPRASVIPTVQVIREVTGLDLKQAKGVFDEWKAKGLWPQLKPNQ